MEQIELARGISEFGMMAVTAAFFLLFSASMMVIFVRWFVKMVNGVINNQNKVMEQLLTETQKQNESLEEIREGLSSETSSRVKAIASMSFDLSVERVCRMIKKVREENHIDNKEATIDKIRNVLQNHHDDRNSKFDSFKYRGLKLSEYTNPEWVTWLIDVAIKEVYDEKPNNGRTYNNVATTYDKIKIDFYKRLKYK